jgi:beta-galactosidase GanA
MKFSFTLVLVLIASSLQAQIPYLKKQGSTVQLLVDNQPFLILGGELGNSTATSKENMEAVWPKLKAMHLNTILVPVYWELIEAEEGVFDFTLYKDLIVEARKNSLKIVFLWFGSWKNSMSSHAPAWVKLNQKKYPRVKSKEGISQEILSSFSPEVLKADQIAFEKLMGFIREYDENENTVIMVQVENEIGMLPSARDHQALAEKAFKEDVPPALLNYLKKNKGTLMPAFEEIWKTNGYKTKGNWETIFGKSLATDEIFMAYYYSLFTHKITEAGKKVYNLPMFVNAALNRVGRKPGEYPSAGPLPHLMDVWKAGGTAIDFLTPDFYNPDFKYWCDLYTQQGDVLFVPEHVFDATVPAKALYSIGHYQGMGFSPFSIESKENPKDEALGKVYELLENLKNLITENQGKGKIEAVMLSKAEPETILEIGKYKFICKNDYTLSWTPGGRTEDWPLGAAIIIQSAEDEFYIVGTGIVITFKNLENSEYNVGILKVDEGRFNDKNWKTLRHLNGDQTHQGRHVNIRTNEYTIQKVKLYNYTN